MSQQALLFGDDYERGLLDQLIEESRLYRHSEDYKKLLDFVVRLRNFAPFNAMLLHVQKPGLSYAALERDWRERFGRRPKDGARPLIILWPFGPVALVYDVMDTEGHPLPTDVASFFARGPVDAQTMASFAPRLGRQEIQVTWIDAGDRSAGSIRLVKRATTKKGRNQYRLALNGNHAPAVQFTTLAHELGHLFLGHLGEDNADHVPQRPRGSQAQVELEAELVAYIVCSRNGAESRSHTYLATYVSANATIHQIDIYQVLRAAGQVESMLGLSAHRPATHRGLIESSGPAKPFWQSAG